MIRPTTFWDVVDAVREEVVNERYSARKQLKFLKNADIKEIKDEVINNDKAINSDKIINDAKNTIALTLSLGRECICENQMPDTLSVQ